MIGSSVKQGAAVACVCMCTKGILWCVKCACTRLVCVLPTCSSSDV
jgi:hypothetical protein